MNIGARIRELRENAELTQLDLAKKLKIRNSTLSMYEKGKIIPSDDIKMSIADFFGVSVDYLLGRNEEKKGPTAKDNGLSDDQNYLISAIYDMSADDVRKLRIIVEAVISPQGQGPA